MVAWAATHNAGQLPLTVGQDSSWLLLHSPPPARCHTAYALTDLDFRALHCSHLLIKLLEDALCETAYLAEVAGLHYGIW